MENFEFNIQNNFLNLFYKPTNSYVHSKYNPEIEADRSLLNRNFSSNSKIIFFGFGVGYLIESFLKKFGSAFDIILIEPILNLLEHEELKKKLLILN